MTSLRETTGLATPNIGLLLDAVPDPMIVTDVDGAILLMSRSAARLLGYSPSDLLGQPLAGLIRRDQRREYTEHRVAFVASGDETGPELETHFVTAHDSVLPIDASVGKLDLDGATYVLLVMREVSDRLANQSRLELMVAIDELTTRISSRLNTPDSEAIDRAIEASIHDLGGFCDASAAYLYTETESGSFVLHSQSKGEGSGGLITLGIESLPWLRAIVDEASISEVRTTGPLTPESAADYLLLREQGVSSLVLIPLRASGRTIGFAGIETTDPERPAWPGEDLAGLVVLQDVLENALERKRIGSELRRVNRVLQAVSECHDALIRAQDEKELLRDVCRIVVEAGGYALAWVGYPVDNDARRIEPQAEWGDGQGYVGNLNLTWWDDGEGRGPAGTVIRTRKPYLIEDTSADPSLSWHLRPFQAGFLSLVAVPMFYGDDVAGVLGVYDHQPGAFDAQGMKVLQRFADDLAYGIAALRARERQREAESQLRELLESKDELIATIAHELRTPLAGVVGFAQLLRDDSEVLDPESRAEMIRLVAEQGMDLTNIVDDLLVAAKSEAGTLEVARVKVDLRAQAAQVLEGWGSDAVKSIEFIGSSAVTTGDPARVRQILRNLVTNALRYGGEQVTVRVGGDQDSVYVMVEDDGKGVASEDQDRIFEPYRRAHDAPGVTASMGLGLSISRDLARLMGGDLSYCQEPGLSMFTLSMPARAE
ncbi:MAG: GAF domain-containing protein [Acidimicrobiia bacterium]